MKTAVSSQCGPSMTAFTILVVQFSPWHMLYSGCSDTSNRGVTHVTGGSSPRRACRTHRATGEMWSEQHLVLPGVLVRATGLGGDRVQVVRERGAVGAGEEVVAEDVFGRPMPVVGEILGQV